MIKNILFDMGNVLIRFEPKEYVKRVGLSEPEQELMLRELYGSRPRRGDARRHAKHTGR